jgi:hypothetical protein
MYLDVKETGYGLDGQGVAAHIPVESRMFSFHNSQTSSRSTNPPIQWYGGGLPM